MSNHSSIHRGAIPHRTARLGTTLSGLALVLLGQACGARYEIGELEPPLIEVEPPLGDDSTGGGGLAAVLVVDGVEDADAELGSSSILPLGDVDGDGFGDWMDFGQLVYGAPRPAEGLTLNSEKGPSFAISGIGKIGLRTAGAGDFNGDGYNDVLVRDPLNMTFVDLPREPWPQYFEARNESAAEDFRTFGQMQAFLWYGGPERSYGEHVLNDEAVGFRVTEDLTSRFRSMLPDLDDGIERGGTYEVRPEAIGDIDGDGYGDLAVTATFSWQATRMNPEAMYGLDRDSWIESMTYVYYGRAERFELAALREPDARLAGVSALTPIGDVNGDGYADMQAMTTEGAHLIGGRAARLPAQPVLGTISVPLLDEHAFANATTSALGDIDGDGFDDFSFMIYEDDGRGPNYLFYGSPSLLQGPLDQSASSAELEIEFATVSQLRGAGDWNGDGRSDLLIWQAARTAPGQDDQALSVIAGTSQRFSGRYEVPPFLPEFAERTVGGLGGFALGADLDGDGREDICFAARGADAPNRWHVKYGGPLTPTIH